MALNTLGLVAGIAVARREGVAPDQVARVALPGAIFPNLAVGVILVDRLAKQEADAEALALIGRGTTAVGTTAVGTTGGGTTGGGGGVTAYKLLPVEPESYPAVAVAPSYRSGDNLTVDPGQWLNLAKPIDELVFQWFRAAPDEPNDREEIEYENNPTYTIDARDVGKILTVDATYIDEQSGGARVTATSPPIMVAGDPTG